MYVQRTNDDDDDDDDDDIRARVQTPCIGDGHPTFI